MDALTVSVGANLGLFGLAGVFCFLWLRASRKQDTRAVFLQGILDRVSQVAQAAFIDVNPEAAEQKFEELRVLSSPDGLYGQAGELVGRFAAAAREHTQMLGLLQKAEFFRGDGQPLVALSMFEMAEQIWYRNFSEKQKDFAGGDVLSPPWRKEFRLALYRGAIEKKIADAAELYLNITNVGGNVVRQEMNHAYHLVSASGEKPSEKLGDLEREIANWLSSSRPKARVEAVSGGQAAG